MRSEKGSWRQIVGIGLLSLALIVSVALLVWAERRYTEFRETLQGIEFSVQLTDFEITPQQARLRWIVTVAMRAQKTPAWLELLEWHVYSADGETYLGLYSTGEIQIALAPNIEIPLEATLEGPNLEKLQRLLEKSPQEIALLFQGGTRVMFQLPRGQENKKIAVVGVSTLPREHE